MGRMWGIPIDSPVDLVGVNDVIPKLVRGLIVGLGAAFLNFGLPCRARKRPIYMLHDSERGVASKFVFFARQHF